MIKDYFKIAIRNLRTRPLRSWLTILGIVIGVFLIISLLSLSEGIKSAMLQELRMMGKDLIMVFPGELTDIMTTITGGLELSDDDVAAVRKTEGVELVVPMVYQAEVVRYQGETKTLSIYGLPWKEAEDLFKTDMGWNLTDGDWPVPGKREVIVGSLVPKDIFPGMRVGTQIIIKGRQFKVVGFLRSLGNRQDDSMVGLDLDIFQEITGRKEGAQFVMAKIEQGEDPDEIAERIKAQLQETRRRKRGEDLPPFSVLTSEKVTGIVSNIMNLVQLAIFGLASIAIVVGGIGIMNTMYTSVHERTREIGIMKAIGAKGSTITMIFLIESGIVGLTGGIGGVILGLGLAKVLEISLQLQATFYMKASITPGLILFGLVFSFLIGCLSGFLPSYQASKLKPAEALRYE